MDNLVSVVVPVYNVEKYLDRCIESIVLQTYSNLEIILVDDGSKDSSGRICDEWAEKDLRIKVVHKENAGLGMARNTGIDHANGKFIFFFDSDDYVDRTIVEKCVADAVAYGSQIVLYGRNNVYDEVEVKPGRIIPERREYRHESVLTELLPTLFTYELGIGVSAWGKMYDLQLLKQHGLYFPSEHKIISEDAYFTLELFSKITNAAVLPECLYYYCVRGNSLSRSYREDRQQKNDEFLTQCCNYVYENNLPESIIKHIESRYHGLTLANLMQVAQADIPTKKKKQVLKHIYRNSILRKTLRKDVIALDASLPGLFWCCLKLHCEGLCTLLLWLNVYKQKMGDRRS